MALLLLSPCSAQSTWPTSTGGAYCHKVRSHLSDRPCFLAQGSPRTPERPGPSLQGPLHPVCRRASMTWCSRPGPPSPGPSRALSLLPPVQRCNRVPKGQPHSPAIGRDQPPFLWKSLSQFWWWAFQHLLAYCRAGVGMGAPSCTGCPVPTLASSGDERGLVSSLNPPSLVSPHLPWYQSSTGQMKLIFQGCAQLHRLENRFLSLKRARSPPFPAGS